MCEQNPGISRQKSLISMVSRGIPNSLAPTPSRGRPPPHRKIPGLKSLGLCFFSCLTIHSVALRFSRRAGPFLDLRNPCAPPVLQTSAVPAPQVEGSRTLNMLLPGCRNALWRSKSIKQGKNRFLDPFLGGGLPEPKRAPDNIPVIFKWTLSGQEGFSEQILKGGGVGPIAPTFSALKGGVARQVAS